MMKLEQSNFYRSLHLSISAHNETSNGIHLGVLGLGTHAEEFVRNVDAVMHSRMWTAP